MFGVDDGTQYFEESFNGNYVKMKEVEQNASGNKFVVTYFDDGVFMMRSFGKEERTPEQIKASEVNLNDMLGLDAWTMAVTNFPDPFITCCFISNDIIFINLYHNHLMKHFHFFYNIDQKKLVGKVIDFKLGMESSKKNFPYKCFYNDVEDEVYSFYRQGHALTIQPNDASKYTLQKITDQDLGQMFLVFNQLLVARTSSNVTIYKYEQNDETKEWEWNIQEVLEIRGFVYFIKGNVRFQISTEEKIYFYIVDKNTLEISLDNVMFNYMNCVQMMIGPKVRYCVTYKTGEPTFNIFRANYIHNFKVTVENKNLEGSYGLEIESLG